MIVLSNNYGIYFDDLCSLKIFKKSTLENHQGIFITGSKNWKKDSARTSKIVGINQKLYRLTFVVTMHKQSIVSA